MRQFLQRSALTLFATSALTACATPNFPIYPEEQATPSVPPAAPPASAPVAPVAREAPMPQAPPPPAAVESRPLDPPQPRTPPPAPPQTTYETVTRQTITGRVVDVAGPPRTHTVERGDSLARVARKLETTIDQLAADNDLKAPYVIHPGDVLKGPATKARAYVVESGDTLFGIARRFGVTGTELAEENGVTLDSTIRVGQRLRLPADFNDRGPVTVTTRVAVAGPPAGTPETRVEVPPPPPPPPPPTRTARAQPQPPAATPSSSAQTAATPTPTPTRPATRPSAGPAAAPTNSPPPADAQISRLGQGLFTWPLRGEVLSGFGPKAVGQRNDGVNIRTSNGEVVRAAAAGEVVYAGDQVPGFGNLVLIKHADGWVTAYGHLSRVDVKMQEKVAQGQQIGLAGSTGGMPEPQLHFEVRYAPSPLERARPVDPMLVLPR